MGLSNRAGLAPRRPWRRASPRSLGETQRAPPGAGQGPRRIERAGCSSRPLHAHPFVRRPRPQLDARLTHGLDASTRALAAHRRVWPTDYLPFSCASATNGTMVRARTNPSPISRMGHLVGDGWWESSRTLRRAPALRGRDHVQILGDGVLGLALFVQPPAPACRDAWRSGRSAPRPARGRASVDANALWHTSDALACMGLDADYRGPHPISGGSDAPIEVVPGGRGLTRPGDAEQHRGAPRLRRGAPSAGGLGGPFEAPHV